MLKDYLASYGRHNRTSVVTLAVLSFIASALLGLIIGVSHMLVTDYLARMAYLNEEPSITGSTIAFAAVTTVSALSLILMLKNAFDVSMSSRIRQLGILKSIGASDKQVKRLLLAEGCTFSLPAACLGVLTGMSLALLLVKAILALTAENRVYEPIIELSPSVFFLGCLVALATIALSALLPARRIGGIGVIKAISQGNDEYRPKRRMGVALRVLSSKLGIEASLAIQSLRSRRRIMRTANASIAFAILAFVTLINFETLSHLSTQITYFERYQDVWDVRVTVDDGAAAGTNDALVDELRGIAGVESVSVGDEYKADSGDVFYNILADSPAAATRITRTLEQRFASSDEVEVLNLAEETQRDQSARTGLRLFVDVFAGVLACIGLSDVFSSVLGRIPERRREVSQLLAAGITRRQVKRMLNAEATLIIAKPLMWAAVLNAIITVAAVQASPVTWSAFLINMPIAHVAVFSLACWLLVKLAYHLGERSILDNGATLAVDMM